MKRPLAYAVPLLALLLLCGWLDPSGRLTGYWRSEPFLEGRAAHIWRKQLDGGDPAARDAATQGLITAGAKGIPVLMFLAEDSRASAETRLTAIDQIGKLGAEGRPALPTLLKTLRDADPHLRSVSATALAAIEPPADQAVPALVAALEGGSVNVPVLRALSTFGPAAEPALELLRKSLNDTSLDPEVRWNSARTIGKMRAAGAPAIPDLITHLNDPAERLREHAAEALGDIGPDASVAVEPLTKTLSDTYFKARRDAVRSLGQIGAAAKPAIPEIKKLLDDPEELVRDAAKTALERIGE